jgi:predicted dehydrogenase
MYRHHAQTLKVKELIDGGAIGDLRLVRGGFSFSLTRPEDVRLKPALDGGSLWDVGCYPVSYSRLVTGAEPVEVFGWQRSMPNGIDVVFAGQLRFPGDVLAQFDCGFDLPFREFMEFNGTAGKITLGRPFKPREGDQIVLSRGDVVENVAVDGGELYMGEVEDMADAVLEGKPPRMSLADSFGNAATLVALYQSAGEGRPVAVKERP